MSTAQNLADALAGFEWPKLPPLPMPAGASFLTAPRQHEYGALQMMEYAKLYARAALEAWNTRAVPEDVAKLRDEAVRLVVSPIPVTDGFANPMAHEKAIIATIDALASRATGAVPAGFALVPIEPTEAMLKAGDQKTWVLPSRDCWDAMLAASPSAPATEAPDA